MNQMKRPRRLAHVAVSDCVACGCCAKVCPRDAIHIWKGMLAQVDASLCIGCGRCAKECPASVITIVQEAANV